MSETKIKRSSIIKILIIIGTFLAFVHVTSFLLFHHLNRPQPQPPLAGNTLQSVETIKGPLLQVSNKQELTELRKYEDEILNSYGWVDRSRQIIRIPISKAMDFLVSKE